MNKPVLSICIPTYNRAELVYKRVNHILKYKGDDIEVVVSNNASTDNTLDLLSTINDSRLTVHSNSENIIELNWPLVVSKGSGLFAALISDEDEICVENIPYFLSLLRSNKVEGVAAIFYSYYSQTQIQEEYCSVDPHEAIAMVLKYAGHITCCILNAAIFRSACEKYLCDMTRETLYEMAPETQFHIVLDTVLASRKTMLTDVPLCIIYEQEKQNIPYSNCIEHIDTERFGGWGKKHRLKDFNVSVENLIKNNDDSPAVKMLLLMAAYFHHMSAIIYFLLSVMGSNSAPNIKMLEQIRSILDYDINDVKKELMDYFSSAMEYLNERRPDSSWYVLKKIFCDIVDQRFDTTIPPDLPTNMRLFIGNCGFLFIQQVYTILGISILETKETSEMSAFLNSTDYDAVVNYKQLSTHRDQYLRGKAFFLKNEFDKAKACFERFLEHAMNPTQLSDIITGVQGIQHTYYYLGVICQKSGDLNAAVGHFAKCEEISKELFLRPNLNTTLLGIS